ncbi:MAG: lipopolysaccharide transport periplasmic protein LptA [Gammaproteobacteria bacterium]|nr:lipopolysaccharide transport periplasmic protein LptA [Gammaproteobacteria bacterium]
MSRTAFSLLLALLPLSLPAADDARRTQPVHLRADRIDIDQKTGASLYQGRVVFSQADFRLTAAQASTTSRAGQLEKVMAQGKPLTFRDRRDGDQEYIEGSADRAELEAIAKRLHLFGAVDIRRGADRFSAAIVHYDQAAGTLIAEGDARQRVRAALKPQSRPMPTSGETKP